LADSLIVMSSDSQRLAWLAVDQHGVLSRAQVLSCAVTAGTLRHRLRPGGPWQRLLPGVYLTTTGQPTREQQHVAAMLFAGPDCAITGPAALAFYAIRSRQTRCVDVLVAHELKRASHGFVAVHRTRRMPGLLTCDGPLRFAPVARAVADTVRGLSERSQVRAVVASAVQQRKCSVGELAAELAEGPVRGSGLFRSVLAEVLDGIRSPAEGDFRDLILQSGLPRPLFNPRLVRDGKLLAKPDAWWPEHGLVAEVDSREWHLSPDDWEATMRRDDRLRAAGIRVLHFSPRQVRTDPDEVVAVISDALCIRPPAAGIVTLPAAA
jgi:hypothetical protein